MRFRKLTLLICSLLSFFAFSDSRSLDSVKWQKYKVESDLKTRVHQLVSQIISQEKFFVEVEIKTKEVNIPVPEYNLVQQKRPKLSDRKGIKINGEYILFDKIGLNAPLYEGNDAQRSGDLQLKIFQYSKRVEREFLSKNDVFNNIEEISIKLGFDTSIKEDQIESAVKMIETMIPNFAGVVPKVEKFSFKFKVEKVKQIGFLERWSGLLTPLGIFLATLLFCITIFFVFKSYQKDIQERENQKNDAEQLAEERSREASLPNSEVTVDPNLRPGSPQLAKAIEETSDGVGRFILFLEKSGEQAIKLVKKWVSLDTKVARYAIALLGERLSIEELYRVLINLTPNERSYFQKAGQAELRPQEKMDANKYLSQQVLEDIFMVNIVDDKELQDLLIKVSPNLASKIIKEHPSEGAYLVNLLSSEFISELFKHLPVELMKEVTKEAIHLKENDFDREYGALKAILQSYTKEAYVNPFLNRIVEWAFDIDVNSYQNLVDTLYESKQFEVLSELLVNRTPLSLIQLLSNEAMKILFKTIPLKLRVEYISLMEENGRMDFLDRISIEGSKNRDVLDFELNKLIEDEASYNEVRERESEVQGAIAQYVEELRSVNLQFSKDLEKIINNWLETEDDMPIDLENAA